VDLRIWQPTGWPSREHESSVCFVCQVKSAVDLSEPLFQSYPSSVKFQNYKPYSVYEQAIFFRNNDNVSDTAVTWCCIQVYQNVLVLHTSIPECLGAA
jgi:hypothetical protein